MIPINKLKSRIETFFECINKKFKKPTASVRSFEEYRKGFVGFWPWPRAFATLEAFTLAQGLKKKNHIHLAEALSISQTNVFSKVVATHTTDDFELELCADGLFLYRDNAIEEGIIEAQRSENESSDHLSNVNAVFSASGSGYRHYVPALNILFLLIESEMHSNGRNNYLYWVKPIARIDLVRQKYQQEGSAPSSITSFGPIDEMLIQRFSCKDSIGARIDGIYHKDLVGAFNDASTIFEKVYYNSELWKFLLTYSNAWTNLLTELQDSSMTLSWSLIERDLQYQVSQLIPGIAVGSLQMLNHNGTLRALSNSQETTIRNKISAGGSLMAGQMIGILEANGVQLHANLNTVKDARNNQQHQGIPVNYLNCQQSLEICKEICQRRFSIVLNNKLQPNPHLGISI